MEKYKNAEPPDEQDLIGTYIRLNECRVTIDGRLHEIYTTKDFAAQINDIHKTQVKPL